MLKIVCAEERIFKPLAIICGGIRILGSIHGQGNSRQYETTNFFDSAFLVLSRLPILTKLYDVLTSLTEIGPSFTRVLRIVPNLDFC